MKISLVTSLAAIAIPFASAQSSAPSAAAPIESLVPTLLDERETLAPSPAESIVIDPKCSAHALCEAEDLADDCCPTIENVFLDCCDLGDFTPPPPPPTPGTSTPAPATPEPTPGAVTPEPTTPAPSSAPVDFSSMPSSETGMDTAVPTDSPTSGDGTATTASPTSGTATTASPTSGMGTTASPTSGTAPSTVTLTPKNYSGCMKVNGNGADDDDFRLASCNASDPKQQFKFVGNLIQLAMDSSKCLQGGRNPMPEDGKYLRVYTCDENESLQRFTWDAPDGALTLLDYPNLAVVFRGTSANVNTDPIILGELNKSEVVIRSGWTILN